MSRYRATPPINLRTSVVPTTISVGAGASEPRRKTRSTSSAASSKLYIPYDGFKESDLNVKDHKMGASGRGRSKSPLPVSVFEDKENEIGLEPELVSKDSNDGGKASLNVSIRSEAGIIKGLTNLEERVEINDRKVSKKVSSLEDRFTELQAHVLYMLSKWPYENSSSSTTGTSSAPPVLSMSKRAVEKGFDEEEKKINIKSPPVPALKRKSEEAEWERSFRLDSSRSCKMIKRGGAGIRSIDATARVEGGNGIIGSNDEEINEDGANQDDIENLKSKISSQEERINTLIEKNQKQAEQMKSLISTLEPLVHLPSSVERLQFEFSALQGHLIDSESRLESMRRGKKLVRLVCYFNVEFRTRYVVPLRTRKRLGSYPH